MPSTSTSDHSLVDRSPASSPGPSQSLPPSVARRPFAAQLATVRQTLASRERELADLHLRLPQIRDGHAAAVQRLDEHRTQLAHKAAAQRREIEAKLEADIAALRIEAARRIAEMDEDVRYDLKGAEQLSNTLEICPFAHAMMQFNLQKLEIENDIAGLKEQEEELADHVRELQALYPGSSDSSVSLRDQNSQNTDPYTPESDENIQCLRRLCVTQYLNARDGAPGEYDFHGFTGLEHHGDHTDGENGGAEYQADGDAEGGDTDMAESQGATGSSPVCTRLRRAHPDRDQSPCSDADESEAATDPATSPATQFPGLTATMRAYRGPPVSRLASAYHPTHAPHVPPTSHARGVPWAICGWLAEQTDLLRARAAPGWSTSVHLPPDLPRLAARLRTDVPGGEKYGVRNLRAAWKAGRWRFVTDEKGACEAPTEGYQEVRYR